MNEIVRHIVGLVKAIDKIVPGFRVRILESLQEF